MRQDLIAAGHHRHPDAEFGIGVAHLRAGDTGADDHQMLRQIDQVVELTPVQDSLAVGNRPRQHPRPGPGGDQHHVCLEDTLLAGNCGDSHTVMRHPGHGVDQLGPTLNDVDLFMQQLRGDVGRLRPGERLDPVVDLAEGYLGVLDTDVEPQASGPTELGAHPGRCDERLGRNAIEEHAGPTHTVGVDDGHFRTPGGRHQCRLVTGRASADDHDPLGVRGSHALI